MLQQGLVNLSQSHLNLLSICPPKFQQIYLDCLGSIPDPKQQEGMQWGTRFHLLMQQRELGLPIESLLASDAELDSSIKSLINAVPELLEPKKDLWREAEHYRTLGYGNFVLNVIYDLLVARSDKAIIFDWKTYRKPQKRVYLAGNWQTRLYLYVLTETSEYRPEQIQMTYWFVKSGKPTSITFDYNRTLHQQTEEDLSELLDRLDVWLEDYQQDRIDLPHQSNCREKCPHYQFLHEENNHVNHQELLEAIADIEEIPI